MYVLPSKDESVQYSCTNEGKNRKKQCTLELVCIITEVHDENSVTSK